MTVVARPARPRRLGVGLVDTRRLLVTNLISRTCSDLVAVAGSLDTVYKPGAQVIHVTIERGDHHR